MINEDLVNYIKAQRDAGMSREDISAILTNDGGWAVEDVAEAFDSLPQKDAPSAVPKPPEVTKPMGADSDPKTYIEQKKYEPKDMMVGGDFFPKEEVEELKTSTEKIVEKSKPVVAPIHTKHGTRGLKIAVVVFAVISLVGASAYAYVSFLKPMPTPYEVLIGSLVAYGDLTSVTVQGTSTLSATTKTTLPSFGQSNPFAENSKESSEPQELSTNLSLMYGVTTSMNDPRRKMDGSVSVRIGGSYGVMSIDIPIDIEYKQQGDKFYVRFTEIGQMPIPMDLSMFKNVWIEFDLGQTLQAVESIYENANAEEREKAQQIIEDVLTAENIIEFINTHMVIKNGSTVGTYQVSVPLSADTLKKFAAEVVVALTNSETFREVAGIETDAEANKSTEEMYNEVLTGYEGMYTQDQWDALDEILRATEYTMVIDKKTLLPRSVRLVSSVYDITIDDSYLDLNILSETEFRNYNEIVEVVTPENAVSIEEIARYVVGDPSFDIYDPLASTRVSSNDAAIRSYLNNVRVHAELYYDTNSGNGYSGLCVSDAVKTVTESVEAISGGLVFCNADDYSYIIEAPLFSGESYYCIDSTGVATEKYNVSTEDALSCVSIEIDE